MTESLFSPSWYRVANLKPRLRGHTRVHRHRYRGQIWYVLQDHAKGQYYRFTPATYQLLGRMNGRLTVQQLWEITTDLLGDDAPTQHEVVQLLGALHSSDILVADATPDTAELLRRSERIERAKWKQKLTSPLAIRLPMIDPDRFLTRTVGLVRPLFTVPGLLVWLGMVLSAVVLGALHWDELTTNIVDRVLSVENLLAIGLVYPVTKALHELGHGYAVKVWGGEVHEMGIMFLVFMPIPYVDASASSAFRSHHRRLVVGAAGIMIELLLAAFAMFLWVQLEPGTLRSISYNVILIGSISALFFNGNPLLRYDGYYILSDLLEIPNMGKRGTQYVAYLVKRYAFRMHDVPTPHTAHGERVWFVTYTIAAFIYRIFIYSAIVLFLAGRFFVIGILLAMWAAFGMLVLPIFKGVKFVVTDASLRKQRPLALAATVGTIAVVAVLLFVVPFPHRTQTEGVIWPPETALVRANTAGFIERVVATPNTQVSAGQLLIECRDPLLTANLAVLVARLAEHQSRYDAAVATDRVQARIIKNELDDARAELARAEERVEDLNIRSTGSGLFVLPEATDLADRYLAQGDLIAFVLDVDHPIVRIVVPQLSVDLVRRNTETIEVRPAERLDVIVQAMIRREVPEAEEHLPSAILGSFGGGSIAIDPTEQSGTKTFERMFQFELQLTERVEPVFIGGRVYVRIDHGYEPLGFQWYRAVRQVFLRRFSI